MGRLIDEKYKLNVPIEKKKSIGFRYDYELDDYAYAFTCYSYQHAPVLICKLCLNDDTGDILINVYDTNGVTYAPFYQGEDRSDVLPIVETNIRKELHKIGTRRKHK
jgi:hypothetical protein